MSKDNKVNLLPEMPAFGGNRADAEGMWLEMAAAFREMKDVMDTHTIYVLEDGETYSGEPTRAVEVTQEQLEEIENGAKVSCVVPDWDLRDENGERR